MIIYICGILLAFVLLTVNLKFTLYAIGKGEGKFREAIMPMNYIITQYGTKAAYIALYLDFALIVGLITVIAYTGGLMLGTALLYAYIGYIGGVVKGDWVRYKIGIRELGEALI